ncbi:unnamed protein product [Diamesa serratosioi]
MGGVFGKSKKQPSRITEQDKAVLQLKQQRDKIKQFQKRIEQSLVKDRELAKLCISKGQKERAKLILRKKKYQENLLGNTDKELEVLEKLTADLEFAQVQQQVIEGLKVGNEALKKVHEVLTIDEVERIMDETREGIEKQQEIDTILSGALTDQDEDEVNAELEALIDIQREPIQVIEEDISDQLPDVPSEDPVAEKRRKKVRDSDERVALEA